MHRLNADINCIVANLRRESYNVVEVANLPIQSLWKKNDNLAKYGNVSVLTSGTQNLFLFFVNSENSKQHYAVCLHSCG